MVAHMDAVNLYIEVICFVKFVFPCKIVVVCSDEGDTSSCSEDEQAGEERVDRDCCFTPTVPPPSPVLPHHRSAKVKFSVHHFFYYRIGWFLVRERKASK